jgi:hypothetical protein
MGILENQTVAVLFRFSHDFRDVKIIYRVLSLKIVRDT